MADQWAGFSVVGQIDDGHPKHLLGRQADFPPFEGVIDEIRISTTSRYEKEFTSAMRLEADKDTFALYHCDEGRGEILVDSSPNKRNGRIVGAKWAPGIARGPDGSP
jgi:hypothetical protein